MDREQLRKRLKLFLCTTFGHNLEKQLEELITDLIEMAEQAKKAEQ